MTHKNKEKTAIELIGKSLIFKACHNLKLSPREIELVLLLLEGENDVPKMASLMKISPGTLRSYLNNIFRKTRCFTRLGVAIKVLTEALSLRKKKKP